MTPNPKAATGSAPVSSDTIWTAHDAAQVTGGKAHGAWHARAISIDSRTVAKGDLFVALQGDNMDGHRFVAEALAKGAAAAMVSHRPDDVDDHAPLLVVEDTLRGLEDLARAARARCGGRMIAVTGSVGKTGTKEMLALACGALGQVHASKASYNNHWGVPYTLAQMHAGTDYGIFEIGMNHAGEITPLTQMVRPHIAIITTIAAVHMEHFESEAAIAAAKAEIFSGIVPGGVAVLNADNPWFETLRHEAAAKGVSVKSFGESAQADARLADVIEAANGSRVKAVILGQEISFTLAVAGRHHVQNALAVLLAIGLAGGDIALAAKALARWDAVGGRGKRELITIGDKDNPVTLIDESYNASPVAMRAAFKVLALIDPGRGGRRIAVLGDMYELGNDAAKMHEDLALPLQAADVQLVYTCGPLMKSLYNKLPPEQRGAHSDDSVELAKIVPDVLVPGDVVMVKGSRGGGEKPRMQVIVEALRALPERWRDGK